MINEIALFTMIMRRINNTGLMMKWWWREGWNKVRTPILGECWKFLIYIILHQKRKQCLEFALPKPGEFCKHLAGAYNSNSHARGASLSYFCIWKTSREINAMGRIALRKNVSEKLSIINSLWRRRRPLQIEFTNIAAKKPQPLLWKDWKRGAGEKGKSMTISP